MIGEIIGALSGLAGGFMNSSAEKKSQEMNYKINAENLAWQKEQFYKLLAEAQRQESEGKEGYRDADGNWVHYVKGKGWQVTLDPFKEYMRNQQRLEDERGLIQDAPLARERAQRTMQRGRDEGSYADAWMEAMHQNDLGTSQDNSAIQRLLATEGINEGYDASMENALRNARATGSTNDAAIAAQSGRARGEDLRRAFLSMPNQQDENYNRWATVQGNLGKNYEAMASRASAPYGSRYTPQGDNTAQLLQSANAAGANKGGQLINAMGQGMNIQNKYVDKPLYGPGTTVAQVGQMFSNMDFSGLGGGGGSSYNRYNAAPTIGADYYKNNVGPW